MASRVRKLFGKIIGKRRNHEVTSEEPRKKKRGNETNMEVHVTRVHMEVKTVQWKVIGFRDIVDDEAAIVKHCCEGCTFSAGASLGYESNWKVNLKVQGEKKVNSDNETMVEESGDAVTQDNLVLVLTQVGPIGPDQNQPQLLNKIRVKIGTDETSSVLDKTLPLTRGLPTGSQEAELVSMDYLRDPSHGLISEEGTLTLEIEITLCTSKTYIEPVAPAASPSPPSSPSGTGSNQLQSEEKSSRRNALAGISRFMSGGDSGWNSILPDAYLLTTDNFRVPVRKAVLAARSPIFRNTFRPRAAQGSGDPAPNPTSGCPNGSNPDDSDDDDDDAISGCANGSNPEDAWKQFEVYIVPFTSAVLSIILLHIYTGQLKEEWAKLNPDQLQEVISAAVQLHLIPLVNYLDEAIALCVTKENLEMIIHLAELFNLTSTLEALKKMRPQ